MLTASKPYIICQHYTCWRFIAGYSFPFFILGEDRCSVVPVYDNAFCFIKLFPAIT